MREDVRILSSGDDMAERSRRRCVWRKRLASVVTSVLFASTISPERQKQIQDKNNKTIDNFNDEEDGEYKSVGAIRVSSQQ